MINTYIQNSVTPIPAVMTIFLFAGDIEGVCLLTKPASNWNH